MTRAAQVERARAQLFPAAPSPAGSLFSVLDAARDGEIERLTTSFQLRFLYLLDGVTNAITDTSPYGCTNAGDPPTKLTMRGDL